MRDFIADNETLIQNLNTEQQDAVMSINGPLLVLAGAGTGKTKVLTTRIAHILDNKQAFPSQILSVTFTNKAAQEMKIRIIELVGDAATGIWAGTFHSIAARILRQHAESIGFSSNFTIIDKDDQLRLAKQILKDFNIDEKANPAKLLLHIIGRFKDKSWAVHKVPASEVGHFAQGVALQLYEEYQKRLQTLNAMDFGDLLMHNIKLFNEHLDICEYYQKKFKYILVDEYQDTNVAQYIWLRLLSQQHNNICCVGDDDQSIYGWRGAEVKNILRFEHDFRNAKIVRLERNYRSTSYILHAATEVISNNKNRHGKKLWTERQDGEKIKLHNFYDDRQEARFVADEIDVLNRLHKNPLSTIAILVRASYQTRGLEESLNALRIPYRIVGGIKFYERAEIKDVIAYIRLLVNPDDSLAFERAINTPRRGIGETTMQELRNISNEKNISLINATRYLLDNNQLKSKAASTLQAFLIELDTWQNSLLIKTHQEVVDQMLDDSKYREMWRNQRTDESKERLDNLKELIRSLGDFMNLSEYLEHISLITDADSISNEDKVNVMTMHAAKGLEFHTVFLPGWEEGVFPTSRSLTENTASAIEEERRLAYVAITRAKQNLIISHACHRRVFGAYNESEASRFIDELPTDSYQIISSFNTKDYVKERSFIKIQKASYTPQNEGSNSWQCGQNVLHDKFGKGKILAMMDNDIAQVMFNTSGFKKISINFLKNI